MTGRIPFCSQHRKEAQKPHVCQSRWFSRCLLRNGSTPALCAEALPESAGTQERRWQFQRSLWSKERGTVSCGTEALSHRAVGKRGGTEEDGLIQNQESIKELQIPPFPSSWNIPLIRCLQWCLLLRIASSHSKKNKHKTAWKAKLSLKETEQVWKLKSMKCVSIKPVI